MQSEIRSMIKGLLSLIKSVYYNYMVDQITEELR